MFTERFANKPARGQSSREIINARTERINADRRLAETIDEKLGLD